MGRKRRWLAMLVAPTILGVALGAATAAEASRIVYVCGDELCAADPRSGASERLTTDGAQLPYRHPSVSRDGQRVAAARGGDVVVGALGTNLTERWTGSRDINGVALAPDGGAVAESHSYVENVYGCPLTGGCLQLVDRSGAAYVRGGSEDRRRYAGGAGVGFLADGTLLSAGYGGVVDDVHAICAVTDPDAESQPCEVRVISTAPLSSPAGSPDGRLIAAAVGDPAPAETTSVVLFEAATGNVVRTLASRAGRPAFSPDGRQVAYAGQDGWIHVVATGGGASRRVVEGHSPAWGGGDPPGAEPGSGATAEIRGREARLRKGRVAVRVRCTSERRCRGVLRLRAGGTAVGAGPFRVRAGRSATVTVRLTGGGRRALAGRDQITARLAPRGGAPMTTTLTLRR